MIKEDVVCTKMIFRVKSVCGKIFTTGWTATAADIQDRAALGTGG
jgi:hypothetical protein